MSQVFVVLVFICVFDVCAFVYVCVCVCVRVFVHILSSKSLEERLDTK